MRVYEKFKQMSIDEMVDFFIKNRLCDAMDICTDEEECKKCFRGMLEEEEAQ